MKPSSNYHEPLHFKEDRRGAQRTETTIRRHSERLYGSCQAIVRGVDAEGETFTEATTLENVSSRGLYIKIHRPVKPGTRLFVVFAFSTVGLQEVQAPRVAARGQVRRVETIQTDEATAEKVSGVGLEFQHHRFL